MRIGTTVSELIIEEEIRKKRQENSKILNTLRIFAVGVFFLLHLLMGYFFGSANFRGKESYFLVYLILAVGLAFWSHRKENSYNITEYSISLIDLPLMYLILSSWMPNLANASTAYLVSLHGLAFGMFFISLSGLFFSKTVTLPTTLASLAAVMKLFSEADTPTDTRVTSIIILILSGITTIKISGQVKSLIANAAQKQSLNDKLSRYFAPEVASFIQTQSSSDNEERAFDVTVLFTDIRDFTKMASSMSGGETIKMLNEVHEHLVSCIFLTGGTLDKYLGDGVMAYFGAPIATQDHADKALECAQMMRGEIGKLNGKRIARGEKPIALGIGIHSGPAVIGDIGAEIRREFTIIGDTVNTSSRIESLTKKHNVDLIFTSETKKRLVQSVPCRTLGFDEIRGTGRQLETFTL